MVHMYIVTNTTSCVCDDIHMHH